MSCIAYHISLSIIQTVYKIQHHYSKAFILNNTIIQPLIFILYRYHDADMQLDIKEILEASDKSLQKAAPLLSMMERKQGEEVPQEMRNIKREMGLFNDI